MNLDKLKCAFCSKNFLRLSGQINEARKFGWKQFCSLLCLANSKTTGTHLECSNPTCKKQFYRSPKEIKKVQRSYCSAHCAAIVNNKKRIPKYSRNYCIICKTQIPYYKKYCSLAHQLLGRKVPIDTRRHRVLTTIQSFHNAQKRIPVKREAGHIYKEARKIFGSWNHAIEAAGFKPNPVLFAEKHIANDGHHCDSLAEKIIDDWLTSKGLIHRRSIPYPEGKRLTVDFVLKNRWVEFFGLAGEVKEYDRLVKQKQNICKKHHIPLVAIYPKDLFPHNRLSEILKI